MNNEPNKEPLSKIILPDSIEAEKYGKVNLITDTEINKKGKVLYVVMDKYRTTVVKQPGLEKPFSTHNKKFADSVAREIGEKNPKFGGVVETLRDALKLVSTSPCNLPKDHPKYNKDKRAPKIRH